MPLTETIATLTAVIRCTAAYWEMLEAWRFQRSADRFGTFGIPYLRTRDEAHPLRILAAEVGGLRSLENLDTEPLPDEDFDRDALPADIRARAEVIRELAENCCREPADLPRPLRQVMLGSMDTRRADQALTDLVTMPLQRAPHLGLLARCWELRANLTVDDAAYVALAELLDTTVLTADA